jgi:hypothetical protein
MEELLSVKLTEKEAKSVGETRWAQKRKWWLILWGSLSVAPIVAFYLLGVFATGAWTWAQWIFGVLSGLGILSGLVEVIYIMAVSGREGKKFVAEVKAGGK